MLTVQINALRVTLKLVGISHPRAEILSLKPDFEAAILLTINCEVSINFQAAIFCRPAEIIDQYDLGNCSEGKHDREGNDRND